MQVLIKVELHNGAGIFDLLNKIDQAVLTKYRPHSYEEADFQCSFLLWKLGGCLAANIAHQTLGCPSINSACRHVGPNCSGHHQVCQHWTKLLVTLL
jgi:hypothetical protein